MQPKVVAIVPHHLSQNQKYLDLTLNSLLQSTYQNLEIVCVADTPEPPYVPEKVRLFHRPHWNTASEKVNKIIKICPDYDHYLIVSDDVIVSKNCVQALVQSAENYPMILGPKSNSDCTSRYLADIELTDGTHYAKVGPDCDYEQIKPYLNSIYNYPKEGKVLIPQPYISFYCVLIPRVVWEKVGELDQVLDSRHNDEDYCYRARRVGAHPMIAMHAFAFHFGSKTLRLSVASGEQQKATDYFLAKWGAHVS